MLSCSSELQGDRRNSATALPERAHACKAMTFRTFPEARRGTESHRVDDGSVSSADKDGRGATVQDGSCGLQRH